MFEIMPQYEQNYFCGVFNTVKNRVHANAKRAGFWDKERNKGEAIALMHSELSEALEWLRHGNKKSDHIPEFSGLEEEMADVIIRIMDFAGGFDLDIAGAVIAKIAYNETREHKHGKEF